MCACCLCRSSRILADGVNEPENADVGDEYREFDAEDPDCQQECTEDADGGKSNRFPLCILILFLNTTRRGRFKYCMYDICTKHFCYLVKTC